MRILSILAQKPYATGSGVYATELIRQWEKLGHQQALICGVDRSDRLNEYKKQFEQLELFPVRFNTQELPFHPMGMSDVMPYPSTRYRDLTKDQAKQLEKVFSQTISQAITEFKPELIVCHHLYFTTTITVENVDLPIAAICHGTCLRQLGTNPFEKERILAAIRRIPTIFALQEEQRQEIISLGVEGSRVEVVGNGYNPEIFYLKKFDGASAEKNSKPSLEEVTVKNTVEKSASSSEAEITQDKNQKHSVVVDQEQETNEKSATGRPVRLAYAGKISRSKGIFSLLRALERIKNVEIELYLAGSASDPMEYAEIVSLAQKSPHQIHFLGQLTQAELAKWYAQSDLFVFPSYYEGLGLAVIEAMACGLRVVVSDTEGLQDWIRSSISNPPVIFVELPTMRDVDVPIEEELPRYESDFAHAIEQQIETIKRDHFRKTKVDMSAMSWRNIAEKILQKK